MQTFNTSIFEDGTRPIVIPENVKVIFVADLFAEDYVGGAELTTQALIDECPFPYMKIRSDELSIPLLAQGANKFWIFGNFARINVELIPTIIGNLSYSILEYDYKYCRYRSPEKHEQAQNFPCDCHSQFNGKLISAFYFGAKNMWWMSEKQAQRYHNMFPFLSEKDNMVLSSVFSKNTLGTIKWLREQITNNSVERKKWLVLGSDSWVKGAQAAEKWCIDNKKDYEVVWGVDYDVMLDKLAHAEGFVYLPAGADTCPRMVIEAKLLGCNLQLNENVQHKDEEWFNTNDLDSIAEYLYAAPTIFWNAIKHTMNYVPKVSGYTTVYNCISQEYPFEECIKSMQAFCNEVCIVDGGSTDGTWERLIDLVMEPKGIKLKDLNEAERESTISLSKDGAIGEFADGKRIRIKQVPRDWNHPRFAVFDGQQKAEARSMCTGDFCWQMDSDEIVHEDDADKVVDLCKKFPASVDIISLPVTEFWGSAEKVRVDILPWKWRLSKNKKNITHGIPKDARRYDDHGNLYAAFGDGCDMIDAATFERLPHVSFYHDEADKARLAALSGNEQALAEYQNWFNKVIDNLPGVFHYSWINIERKIKLYKNYWTKHWEILSGKSYEDTAESNMMFDVPWSQVTDDMIKNRAKEFAENLGGWIWHKKWDGKQKTPHIKIDKSEPKIMSKGNS